MDIITLDGVLLAERTSAMDHLTEALSLPDWWGRNLDALYVCLTDCREPRRLVIEHRTAMEAARFGRAVLRVLTDAAQDNPNLEMIFPDA